MIWGVKIEESHMYQMVYQSFFAKYNDGVNPADISKELKDDFDPMMDDPESYFHFWFGLASCLWETNALDDDTYTKVEDIIDSDQDLEFWKAYDGKVKMHRLVYLRRFLKRLSKPNELPRLRAWNGHTEVSEQIRLYSDDPRLFLSIGKTHSTVETNYMHAAINWRGSVHAAFAYESGPGYLLTSWEYAHTLEIRFNGFVRFKEKLKGVKTDYGGVRLKYVKCK